MTEFHSASFFAGAEYWQERGRKIGRTVQELLGSQGKLNYPVILPATRKTQAFRDWAELSTARLNPDASQLIVDSNEPVVRGFLMQMGVDAFPDLDRSPFLQELGYCSTIGGIFRGEDYTQVEKDALTGGVYLPAVRVDFVPNQSQPQ